MYYFRNTTQANIPTKLKEISSLTYFARGTTVGTLGPRVKTSACGAECTGTMGNHHPWALFEKSHPDPGGQFDR